MKLIDVVDGVVAGVVAGLLVAAVIGLSGTTRSGPAINPSYQQAGVPHFWMRHGKVGPDYAKCWQSGRNFFYRGQSICEHGQT
jgi:hypothetical protein